ncbi:MAG: hypothetical protein JWO92_707 [Chitinophagaceae bacterium]|nr:hypothetical protein [Chitinophagaceae bacterium]
MKYRSFAITIVLISILSISCKKDHLITPAPTTTPVPVPLKQGALLFWTNDPAILNTCGILTIKLNNGQQTNIIGYYFVAPANCVNLFGGYLLVNEGTYTFQVISGKGCNIPGGSVTVIGERCNMARIQ